MTPVKSEYFKLLGLVFRVEYVPIHPWEVLSRRFVILSGLLFHSKLLSSSYILHGEADIIDLNVVPGGFLSNIPFYVMTFV